MKTLKDINVEYKTVILRCDLNVTIENDKIIDDTKIRKSLKTIEYLLEHNAKVLIMSHLGKIETEKDKEENNMLIVYNRLKSFLKDDVDFISHTHGFKLKKAVKKLPYGKTLLMQNTRYEDLNKNKESGCDMKLAKYWAKLGDIFVNDAFGTIHRAHASNYGISCFLPSVIGFLVEDEIKNLNMLDNPKKPFVLIMGGSKVSDKIKVIENLIEKIDYLLIGGKMAFTFLKASGYEIGSCPYEKDQLDYCKDLLKKYKDKIILPVDLWGLYEDDLDHDPILENITDISDGYIGFDIGDETINKYKSILSKAKTVFWNGPLGKYEDENFILGTKEILSYLAKNTEVIILGGGDMVSSASLLELDDNVTFASTGGGATLKYLEDHNQPGLENMK